MDSDVSALVARVRAALKLLQPTDITPMGVRVIEKVLDAAEMDRARGVVERVLGGEVQDDSANR